MIVADTNLLIHLLVDGPNTRTAMEVREKDPDWRAPFLWRSEFRNAHDRVREKQSYDC